MPASKNYEVGKFSRFFLKDKIATKKGWNIRENKGVKRKEHRKRKDKKYGC